MKIYKQNNKVLCSNSGEILTFNDALIDLRSTFGLNKTGDNVNYAKLFNQPNKLFRNVLSNCVETGDGFDFNLNTGAGRLETYPFADFPGDFYIGWWGKYKTSTLTSSKATFGCYPVGSPSVYCFLASSTNQVSISLNGIAIAAEDIVRINPDLTNWNYFAIERVGPTIHFTKNGDLSGTATSSIDFITNNNKMHIANLGGVNNFSVNDFKLDDFKIYAKSINNYVGKSPLDEIFTPPTRSSE